MAASRYNGVQTHISLPDMFNLTSALLAGTARGWRGSVAKPAPKLPAKPLELYEFEGCPFCRLTREVLTELDLDVMIYPCPRGGQRFRPEVKRLGGKQQFPFLVDPNTGVSMYESSDINAYLYKTYGGRLAPSKALGGTGALLGSQLATALRGLKGMRARSSNAPEKPLELYSFESSPYSRPVRELLCELEVPYLLRNFGKAHKADMGPPWVRNKFYPDAPLNSRNRRAMREQTGRSQVPYLIDPNTGKKMFESADIRKYLLTTYGI